MSRGCRLGADYERSFKEVADQTASETESQLNLDIVSQASRRNFSDQVSPAPDPNKALQNATKQSAVEMGASIQGRFSDSTHAVASSSNCGSLFLRF